MGDDVLPFIVNQRQDYDVCETPAIANRFFCTNKVMYGWRRIGDQATQSQLHFLPRPHHADRIHDG